MPLIKNGRLAEDNSSKITIPTPSSSGSFWMRRVRMPSVTTSTRVVGDTRLSKRIE